MTIQTPADLALDAADEIAWSRSDDAIVDEAHFREIIVRAIEADRAQPRFLLISEHDDAGVLGMYFSRQEAIEAATANCDNDPEIWDEYYSIQEV